MSTFQVKYKNKKFGKERVELDGHSYENCDFTGCLIILASEGGEPDLAEACHQHAHRETVEQPADCKGCNI